MAILSGARSIGSYNREVGPAMHPDLGWGGIRCMDTTDWALLFTIGHYYCLPDVCVWGMWAQDSSEYHYVVAYYQQLRGVCIGYAI